MSSMKEGPVPFAYAGEPISRILPGRKVFEGSVSQGPVTLEVEGKFFSKNFPTLGKPSKKIREIVLFFTRISRFIK